MTRVLHLPCLCLVADCSVVNPGSLTSKVAQAVDGGVNLVQLRAKELPGGQLLALAMQLKEAIEGRALLLVNERVDVAAAAGADGVQLGEAALPVPAARRLLPPRSLIGRSVHGEAGAEQAASDGADFLIAGTMFATGSHPGEAPAGPGLVRKAAARCNLPIIGIGGITPDNAAEVMDAGASGVAVIRSILTADAPRDAARRLSSAMSESWREGKGIAGAPNQPAAVCSS